MFLRVDTTQGVKAYDVRLVSGFYPRFTNGKLTLTDSHLRFEPQAKRLTRRRSYEIPFDSVQSVSTKGWPHPLVAVLLWFTIPWPAFAFGDRANLNIASAGRWRHLWVDDPEDIARSIRSRMNIAG